MEEGLVRYKNSQWFAGNFITSSSSEKKKSQYIELTNFHDVNNSTMANVKFPVWNQLLMSFLKL